MGDKSLRILMYPWLAMGHLTSFLHIANKLAERGHKVFFVVPAKTLLKLEQFNLHSDLIQFIPLTVPHVEGLPVGAETSADVPFTLHHLIQKAMDLTEPTIETLLQELKPHIVFFDFQHWLPALTCRLDIKSIHYCTISPAALGFLFREDTMPESFKKAPDGFPLSSIKVYSHEGRVIDAINSDKGYGNGVTFVKRLLISMSECDAIGFKTCREMEGPYCDFLEKKFKKPVILAGPVIPEPPSTILDHQWANWLNKFGPKTVIFCAFGSECRMRKDQFQELLLGIELSGFPFLVVLKPPIGTESTEEGLPENFNTQERGIVHGGWIQQQLILAHPSIGCFVTHCGSGSLSEAMVNECQLVLLPNIGDQIINARVMGGDLKVGLEIEKGDEDGLFTKEGVCKAIKMVMEPESEIGKEVRANHGKWREFLLSNGLEKSYVDDFVEKLKNLVAMN